MDITSSMSGYRSLTDWHPLDRFYFDPLKGGEKMFKSEDQKRQEEARRQNRVCPKCGGTGTVGIGGRGSFTSSICKDCGGSGQK